VRATLERLGALPGAELDALAGRVLAGEVRGSEVALTPFLGAALQVTWTSAAATVPAAEVPRAGAGCPVCGSAPVVGLVLGDDKLRYLLCGLCATQWHHTRAQCVLCRSSGQLSYLEVEGGAGPAKAEACGACQAYLKVLYVEKAPHLEPFADDVATLALDLLLAEQGLDRLGRNLFLVPGESSAVEAGPGPAGAPPQPGP
jgi:FdhE protein